MTSEAPAPAPWKGLDPTRKPIFLSYDQVERMVAALLPAAANFQPDEVVGVARGGLVPAAMAAGILALPLSFLTHDRATGTVTWLGPPASGHRVLLVDDCCSSGVTLHRARAKLIEEGRQCLTLVVVHDPDVARYLPDLSHPMRELFRLPWERGEATPTGRAAKAAGANPSLSAEAPYVGVSLNDALLAAGARLPPLPVDRAVLICDRPETERVRIVTTLAATPWRLVPLELQPSPITADNAAVARLKAAAAIRWGCTHFIDCDAEQAIAIAGHAPHLIVTWWSVDDARGWTIGAAEQPDAAAD